MVVIVDTGRKTLCVKRANFMYMWCLGRLYVSETIVEHNVYQAVDTMNWVLK